MSELTAERLRQMLTYDPETGVFRWIASRGRSAKAGSVAGTMHSNGYRQIVAERRSYYAHRLAWLYMHGCWPAAEIDHINGLRDDNRLCNLREASRSENLQNQSLRQSRNKTSGMLGVYLDKSRQRWAAQIRVGGKCHSLGRFKTFEEAQSAYLRAKAELHPFSSFWRGAA